MRWQKKLTKKQLKHLRDMGITTLSEFWRNREWQKGQLLKAEAMGLHIGAAEPCWECRDIADRLREGQK